jgi:ABC-type lipoprotein export system ATPase subunit
MQLSIHNLVPEPIRDRIGVQPSEIWNNVQHFNQGDVVLLRAASGKGKSTFMHIIYGLRTDYSGTAQWDQHIIGKQRADAIASWRSGDISIVFQDLRLFGELTVEENILLKHSLQKGISINRVQEWLQQLGVADKWNQRAETLSYGERQRVAIVRSLLQPFKWLLLDEPFSHLDDENSRKAAKLIQDRVEELKAGLIVVDLEDDNWFPYTRKHLL